MAQLARWHNSITSAQACMLIGFVLFAPLSTCALSFSRTSHAHYFETVRTTQRCRPLFPISLLSLASEQKENYNLQHQPSIPAVKDMKSSNTVEDQVNHRALLVFTKPLSELPFSTIASLVGENLGAFSVIAAPYNPPSHDGSDDLAIRLAVQSGIHVAFSNVDASVFQSATGKAPLFMTSSPTRRTDRVRGSADMLGRSALPLFVLKGIRNINAAQVEKHGSPTSKAAYRVLYDSRALEWLDSHLSPGLRGTSERASTGWDTAIPIAREIIGKGQEGVPQIREPTPLPVEEILSLEQIHCSYDYWECDFVGDGELFYSSCQRFRQEYYSRTNIDLFKFADRTSFTSAKSFLPQTFSFFIPWLSGERVSNVISTFNGTINTPSVEVISLQQQQVAQRRSNSPDAASPNTMSPSFAGSNYVENRNLADFVAKNRARIEAANARLQRSTTVQARAPIREVMYVLYSVPESAVSSWEVYNGKVAGSHAELSTELRRLGATSQYEDAVFVPAMLLRFRRKAAATEQPKKWMFTVCGLVFMLVGIGGFVRTLQKSLRWLREHSAGYSLATASITEFGARKGSGVRSPRWGMWGHPRDQRRGMTPEISKARTCQDRGSRGIPLPNFVLSRAETMSKIL